MDWRPLASRCAYEIRTRFQIDVAIAAMILTAAKNDEQIPAIVEVSDGLTSQSRHSLVLRGSPPAGKLLIPFERRVTHHQN